MKINNTEMIRACMKYFPLVLEGVTLPRRDTVYELQCGANNLKVIINAANISLRSFEFHFLRNGLRIARVWIDDDDLFDEMADDISKKGKALYFDSDGIQFDLNGIRGLHLQDSDDILEIDEKNLESSLFQYSTIYNDVPDEREFSTFYTSVQEFLSKLGCSYCAIQIHNESLSEEEAQSIIKGIRDELAYLQES